MLMIRRRLSIMLDRPEAINEDDIDTPMPSFCQELDATSIHNQLALIYLTRLWSRVHYSRWAELLLLTPAYRRVNNMQN